MTSPIHIAAALALAVMAAAPVAAAPAAAASDPAALRLIAQLKAATGGRALDRPAAFHETGRFVRDGKPGTYEVWGDLHALRSAGSHTMAGVTSGGGFDGDAAWHVGPDGKAQRNTDPQALKSERMGTYITIGGYFYPDRFPAAFRSLGRRTVDGRTFDLVEVTPQDALSAELWLDAKTHRLARLTAEADGVKLRGEVSDYRKVDGTWIGFALNHVEGDHHMTQTLTRYRYVPLDPSRFRPGPQK